MAYSGSAAVLAFLPFSKFSFKEYAVLVVVAHTFNPSLREAETDRRISDFEVSLVCRGSSRTAKATQRNPVWRERERRMNK